MGGEASEGETDGSSTPDAFPERTEITEVGVASSGIRSLTQDRVSKPLSWAKDLPAHIQQSLFSRNALDQRPSLNELEDLWSDVSFRNLFNLGQRKTFIRVCLEDNLLWGNVPSQIQSKLFEIFMENGVLSAADIKNLTVEEILSMDGLPSKVDEKMAAGIIKQAEAAAGLEISSLNVTLPFRVAPSAVVLQSAITPSGMASVPEASSCSAEILAQVPQIALPCSEGNIAQMPVRSGDGETITVSEVYKFLDLSSDRQNGGLVEKIVIPPAQIKQYCEAIVERSCSSSSTKIDFRALDETQQLVHGVCGQRRPILEFLMYARALPAATSTGEQKPCWSDAPGMYGLTVSRRYDGIDKSGSPLVMKTLYIVLWPRDNQDVGSHPKSLTSTLMRYLTQLCSKVHVCLDEVCARGFPSDRKQPLPTRRLKYKIERELVEEESFQLHQGFQVPTNLRLAVDTSVIHSAPAMDGAAILSSKPMAPERSWHNREFRLRDSEDMQSILKQYNFRLHGDMPLEEKLHFFSLVSSACESMTKDVRKARQNLKEKHESGLQAAVKDVENQNMDLHEDVVCVLLADISQKLGKYWPELGNLLRPELTESDVEARQQVLITENIKAYHHFSALSNRQSFYKDISLEDRVLMCVVIFVRMKADKVSKERVWGLLTWDQGKIYSDFDHTGYWHRQKISKEEVSRGLTAAKQSECCVGLDGEDDEVVGALLTELNKALHKLVKERTPDILRLSGFALADQQEKRRALLKGTQKDEARELEREWIQKLETAARDQVSDLEGGSSVQEVCNGGVEAGVDTAEKSAGEVEEKTPKPEMSVLHARQKPKFLTLDTKVQQVEKPGIEVAVFQLVAGQAQLERVGEYPLQSLTPEMKFRGSIKLASSLKIVAAWLVRESLIVVAYHGEEASSIISYDMQTREGRVIKKFSKEITSAFFDEQLRLLGIYLLKLGPPKCDGDGGEESSVLKSDIAVYRFDEHLSQVSQVGKILELVLLPGESQLSHLTFLPGCHLIALLDVSNRLRFFNVRQQCLLTHSVQLKDGFSVASLVSTAGGLALLAISNVNSAGEVEVLPFITPSYTPLPPVVLPHQSPAVTWMVGSFGRQQDTKQVHLMCVVEHDKCISSHLCVATSRAQSQVITQQTGSGGEQGKNEEIRLTYLENFFYMFDKFPVQGEVESAQNSSVLRLSVLFYCSHETFETLDLSTRVKRYMEGVHSDLMNTKKPLDRLKLLENLRVNCMDATTRECFIPPHSSHSGDMEGVGRWLQRLICLVPLQIARAEENRFMVLSDGLLLPEEQARTLKQCVEGIRLGMYSAILEAWKGPVLAVSSMGKQSTGKSYTLNHLFGISFEISGARCTDGCWMTLCPTEEVLYVVLDFEGLGSFERTDQEDMLLSVFNAALSGLTIFKTEYRLDRDIEQMFGRFQAGVGLIKGDPRLFKGHLCIAIKDVMSRDVSSVGQEFRSKIGQITTSDSNSNDDKDENFISVMYSGEFTILPFPPLGESSYYNELKTVRQELQERPIFFHSGSEFAECMKTLMAKILLKDWRSMERQVIESRLHFLDQNLEGALQGGRLSRGAEADSIGDEELVCIETQEVIFDQVIILYLGSEHPLKRAGEEELHALRDVAIVLHSAEEAAKRSVQLSDLMACMELFGCKRTGENHLVWFDWYSELVAAVVQRRVERVEGWVKENLVRFEQSVDSGEDEEESLPRVELDDEAAKFVQLVSVQCRQMQKQWQVCGVTCSHCHLRCLSPRGHEDDLHSCMGSHKCIETCFFCDEEGSQGSCAEKMGHSGRHDCRVKSHTCGQECALRGSLNCNEVCSKKSGHEKDESSCEGPRHMCSALNHLCGHSCSALNCRGKCQVAHGTDHTVHKCMDGICTHLCSVPGCLQGCSARDHFHGTSDSVIFMEESGRGLSPFDDLQHGGKHFCGQSHNCMAGCECEGICAVTIEMKQEEEEYFGARGVFKYNAVSEANGERKECCIPIPPFTTQHVGDHRHTRDPAALHSCDQRCPTCNYFCEQPFGHEGVHSGAHGMMRRCYFVSDQKNIDIGSRKYEVGESGRAEMCDMFCRTLKRGHIHIAACDAEGGARCTHASEDGRRHQSCSYGPDPSVPKDELTHECHWASIGWKDPCFENERKEFGLCSASCGHDSHTEGDEGGNFCQLSLWHTPMDRASYKGAGHVSGDGHKYACAHRGAGSYHIVLVLDESSSMGGTPWHQLVFAVKAFLGARVGGGGGDLCSIIMYNHVARIVWEATPVGTVSAGFPPTTQPNGGTNFAAGLRAAYEVLQRSQATLSHLTPLLLFMSDGESNNGEAEMSAIGVQIRGLEVYTVGFGDRCDTNKMKNLASRGGGTYLASTSGIQLQEAFMTVASRMGKKVSLVASKSVPKAIQGCQAPPSLLSREDQRLFEHRINGEAKAKEDVTMEKLKEGAVKKVAAIKMGKTLLEFLKEVGVEVVGVDVDGARRVGLTRFHPDKNRNGSAEHKAYCEEVFKTINNCK